MSLHASDPVIARLVRVIMKHGKKHAALRIVDESVLILRRDYGVERPVSFIRDAIENAKPLVEVRKYRVGGRAIQVPAPCAPARSESIALRNLRDAFRARKENGSGLKLAREIWDLGKKSGETFRMREDLHRLAEANRAFAHFLR